MFYKEFGSSSAVDARWHSANGSVGHSQHHINHYEMPFAVRLRKEIDIDDKDVQV